MGKRLRFQRSLIYTNFPIAASFVNMISLLCFSCIILTKIPFFFIRNGTPFAHWRKKYIQVGLE
jgi:hypothetical protein